MRPDMQVILICHRVKADINWLTVSTARVCALLTFPAVCQRDHTVIVRRNSLFIIIIHSFPTLGRSSFISTAFHRGQVKGWVRLRCQHRSLESVILESTTQIQSREETSQWFHYLKRLEEQLRAF